MIKRWCPIAFSKTGPTCQSRTAAPVASEAAATALSISSLTRCSPNAERQYFVRPVNVIKGGASDSNRTVSPITCDQSPAQVDTTIA